jgi:hypothetical protein
VTYHYYEGPPEWRPPPLDLQQPLNWQELGYPPPPGYPGRPPYGYPAPLALPRVVPQVRVAPPWTGAVIALGGLLAALGSGMTWARYVLDGSTVYTVAGTDGARGGKSTTVLGVALIAVGIVVLARQGRLWIAALATVVAGFAVVTVLIDIDDIHRSSADLAGFARLEIGPGPLLVLAASLVALGGAVVALSIGRVMDP